MATPRGSSGFHTPIQPWQTARKREASRIRPSLCEDSIGVIDRKAFASNGVDDALRASCSAVDSLASERDGILRLLTRLQHAKPPRLLMLRPRGLQNLRKYCAAETSAANHHQPDRTRASSLARVPCSGRSAPHGTRPAEPFSSCQASSFDRESSAEANFANRAREFPVR